VKDVAPAHGVVPAWAEKSVSLIGAPVGMVVTPSLIVVAAPPAQGGKNSKLQIEFLWSNSLQSNKVGVNFCHITQHSLMSHMRFKIYTNIKITEVDNIHGPAQNYIDWFKYTTVSR
jgi:hypothetical protein